MRAQREHELKSNFPKTVCLCRFSPVPGNSNQTGFFYRRKPREQTCAPTLSFTDYMFPFAADMFSLFDADPLKNATKVVLLIEAIVDISEATV
jgi:hypothetical protein